MEATLIRIRSSEHGISGVFVCNDLLLLTLERPWKDNQEDISCIPTGDYVCKRILSPTKGNTFKVTNVLSRDGILFHKGNTEVDTHGCILLGTEFGTITSLPAVLNSKEALAKFLLYFQGQDSFNLTIQNQF